MIQDLSWIVDHYGTVTIDRQCGEDKSPIIASCPVWNGTATGEGATVADAIDALYRDLTAPTRPAASTEGVQP